MLFQNDLNVAMTLIVNNGIYQKVERDITSSTAFRDLFDGFWIPELLRSNKPLNVDHTLPSFIALGLGLISSTFVFLLEVIQKRRRNHIVGSQPRPSFKTDVPDPKREDNARKIGN